MGSRKKAASRRRPAPGSYAYQGLDRVLHEKARLGILTALVTQAEGALFTELKEFCSLTDGNLSRHLQVLQEAGLVEIWKGTEGGRPQTLVRLSEPGRSAFQSYLAELEQVIEDARRGTRAGSARDLDAPPGWVPA